MNKNKSCMFFLLPSNCLLAKTCVGNDNNMPFLDNIVDSLHRFSFETVTIQLLQKNFLKNKTQKNCQ